MTDPVLKDRIALITGASRGIGRATAKLLAADGAHVLLLGRDRKRLEAVDDEINAAGGKATLIPLDLANGAAIDPLGPSLYERFGRLDIFVGNAAILGGLRPLNHIPSQTWEKVLAVNLTANWRLIRTLDPLLRLSDAGRVVFVTSSRVAAQGRAYWAPYSVSKAGLETLAKTYANETADSAIKVNIVDPRATATSMRAEAYPGEDQSTLKSPAQVAETIVKLCLPSTTDTGQIVPVG
ncbi:SDR family NAD(P)-dependent oxidoreductase [Methyloceanibacter caenitepidi]|uniref:NAD/NADP dependent oxidoreductase n=1 Tax=Methyloceanibacter caenitepidi TaxID=1384459 RepID=A0A0A8K3Y5_9HYPH|nr:SDR family NAD(P)-dependent oxidoreductase [Methyloceanibacter caenitepidi]BAQ17620.1 NAD/NADP dependent oxidoreductase [Methyloceanibacter caenitepidi]